jgi:hypothetical protein
LIVVVFDITIVFATIFHLGSHSSENIRFVIIDHLSTFMFPD